MEADVTGTSTGQMDATDCDKPEPVGLGLDHCPIYHPTEEEFLNPLEYIGRIRQEAEQYGICKICPPSSWNPPFMVDKENFSFETRIQAVNELQNKISSTPEYKAWNSKWLEFLKALGKERKRNPTFCGREIDLFKFYRLVEKRGGYAACCDKKLWREVARYLGVVNGGSNLTYGIRTLYAKTFERFDKWLIGDMNALTGSDAEDVKPKEAAVGPVTDVERAQAEEAAAILESLQTMEPAAAELAPAQPVSKAINSKKRKTSEKRDAGKKKKPPPKVKKVLALAGLDGTRIPANIDTLLCEICAAGHCEDKIILCDRCDKGFHLFCLSPPLDDVPDGEWICPHCISRDNDNLFFKTGSQMTFREMRDHNNTFAKQWFGDRVEQGTVTPEELEHTFWDVVESGEEPVEVFYGADLNTGAVGSGFPRRGESESPYATHPWNINNFPKLDGEHASLLKNVDEAIQGVIVPWLYIGMMFSAFCWHVEDHMFYSINYNHHGAPKQWYGVPSAAASDFEATFRACQPELCAHQPDVLFHLVTMLSPRRLKEAAVPVYSCLQRAGEFVITFPNAYHGGFNHGVNAAEAVNFVPADWLRFGAASQLRYRSFRKPGVLCHEELLIDAADVQGVASISSALTNFWLAREVARTVNEEVQLRYNLWAAGVRKFNKAPTHIGFLPEPSNDHPECVVCKAFLYLHAIGCSAAPGRYCCAHHAHALCDLPPSKWTLHYRFSIHELRSIEKNVASKGQEAQQPAGDTTVAKWRPPVLISKDDTPPVAIPDHLLIARPPTPPLATSARIAPVAADRMHGTADAVHAVLQHCLNQVCAESEPCDADNSDQSHDTAGPAMHAEGAFGTLAMYGKEVKAESEDGAIYETRHMADTRKVRAAMAQAEAEWVEKAGAIWQQGGVRPAEVDELLDTLQQFQWGEADPNALSAAHNSIQSAKDWYSDVQILLRNPVGLETAGPYVENTTLPIASQPVARLCEQVRKTRAWVSEVEGVRAAAEGGMLPLATAEELLARGTKLPMSSKVADKLAQTVKEAQEVRKLIRNCIIPFCPAAKVAADTTVAAGNGAAVATDAAAVSVDAQGDVCMAPGAEDSSMQGNAAAAPDAPVDTVASGDTGVNGRVSAASDAMEEDTSLQGRLVSEGGSAKEEPCTMHGDQQQDHLAGVKLSAAPPAASVAVGGEVATGVKEEGVETSGQQLQEEEFRELQAKVQLIQEPSSFRIQVTFPELATVEEVAAAVDAWKARAVDLLATRSTLDNLESLHKDAERVAVLCTELPTITRTVIAARKWISQAMAAMGARRPLREMRKLLHGGERMAVEMECASELKQCIRRREWEERSSKALSSKGSLSAAQALITEAESMGIEPSCKGATALAAAITEAAEWDTRATALMALCDAATAAVASGSAPTPPTLEELSTCIGETASLRLRAERQPAMLSLQAHAHRWQASAASALAPSGSNNGTAPHACDVERLAVEGRALGLALPALADLEARLTVAKGLAETAQALLKEPASATQIPALEQLRSKAAQEPIAIAELADVDLRLAALAWEARVHTDFASCLAGEGAAREGAAKPTMEEACAAVEQAKELAVDEAVRVQLRNAVLAGFAWETTAAVVLNIPQPAVPSAMFRDDQEMDAAGALHTPPALEIDDNNYVMMSSAQDLVTLAAQLAVTPPSAAAVAAAVERQAAFEKKADQICSDATAWEAWHAARAARRAARERGDSVAAEEDSEKPPETTRLSLHEIAAHIQTADSSTFSFGKMQQLRSMLNSPADALGELRRILTKKGTAVTQKMDRCVAAVAHSAQTMHTACDRVFRNASAEASAAAAGAEVSTGATSEVGESSTVAAPTVTTGALTDVAMGETGAMEAVGAAGPGLGAQGDTVLFCLCQQEYEEGQQMVCCDLCSGWFHLKCCNLTAAAARNAETWACPICSSAADPACGDLVQPHLARIHRTRCPTLQELEEVLEGLEACAAVVPEEAALRLTIANMHAWQSCIAEQLKVPAGHPTAAPEQAWMEIARQTAAIEIDAEETRSGVLARLRLERWAARTTALLAQPDGAPLEEVQAALEAAATTPGSEDSVTLEKAKAAVAQLGTLQERSRVALANIGNAHARTPEQIKADVEAAAGLRHEAQNLPVRDEVLLAQLQDASATYCLCGLPNKLDGGMLQCSQCPTLFHLACVGIPREKEPKNFVCPKCCGTAGHRYAWADHLPPASVTALLRDIPSLAAIALPEAPRTPPDANAHPPKPSDIPKLEDQVTIPRGYIDYLETLLSQYTSSGATPLATPNTSTAGAVPADAATLATDAANPAAPVATAAEADAAMHGTTHAQNVSTVGVSLQVPHSAPTDTAPLVLQQDTPVATDQEMTDPTPMQEYADAAAC